MSSGSARSALLAAFAAANLCVAAWSAPVVPTDIQQPGTQPGEAGTLESPDKCDNCHGNYNRAVEPAFNWRGSMMANAGRDPIFWATVAVAEQDFDGAGDLCIRCHSTAGWQAGRSTPTDGSGLTATDSDGVECEACHKSANPDDTEHRGAQSAPFLANDEHSPATGYYGSGMMSLYPGAAKLGPYADADARHQFQPSKFHRDVDFCGSCHDVSNPAVGDLAHNNGKQNTGGTVVASGVPGSPVSGKAAFNNLPYQYGVVERTWSEFMSGAWSRTRVSGYPGLPADLKAGAIQAAYESAGGDYADGSPRFFSCQTCHMRAVTGQGCNKAGVQVRRDLPLHDMTGGNYWAADAIRDQNAKGTLRLGGGMTAVQLDALSAGKARAQQQLQLAASLTLSSNTLKVTNLTGHKLISGYPEGRRMWLNVQWYDAANGLLREDGTYGPLAVTIDGVSYTVHTLLNPGDPNTKVYEAHYGMTQEWAAQLLALGYPRTLPLSYDRVTGAVTHTLQDLANQAPGSAHETFHFVLNNAVLKDNRIPPYGFSYEEARKRNALPVPASQYGGTVGGTYAYWDERTLSPPAGAVSATIRLMYQSTSWEYVQFLKLANTKGNAFLADEGDHLLDTWLNTGMSEPQVMTTATWGTPPAASCANPGMAGGFTAKPAKKAITLAWSASNPAPAGGYRLYYTQAGKLQFRAGVGPAVLTYKDGGLTSRVSYTYVATAWNDCNANGVFDVGVDTESATSNPVTATAQ
jgi:hypothetical protein